MLRRMPATRHTETNISCVTEAKTRVGSGSNAGEVAVSLKSNDRDGFRVIAANTDAMELSGPYRVGQRLFDRLETAWWGFFSRFGRLHSLRLDIIGSEPWRYRCWRWPSMRIPFQLRKLSLSTTRVPRSIRSGEVWYHSRIGRLRSAMPNIAAGLSERWHRRS